MPEYILGDFDSIRPDVMQYYKNLNVPSLKFTSQDETDFEKTLMFVIDENRYKVLQKDWQIIAIGGIGGRFDQTIQNLSILVKYCEIFKQKGKDVQFFIINNSSLVTCIMPGITKYIRNAQLEHKQGVGIVPIKENTKVRTFGFRWDLDEKYDGILRMGNFISANNQFTQNEVYIETDQPLIFTTRLLKF